MSDISVQLTDNTGEILNALDNNLDKTLEMLGLQAAGYAALELESNPRRVDTGLLRNSITYAVAGEAPAKQTYQNDGHDKHDNSVPVETGSYQGKMAKGLGEHSVYIGTNVEYAIYVHEGAKLPNGGTMEANRFLRNAVTKHVTEYERMIDKGLKGEL